MKFLWSSNVYRWRMTGLLGKGGAWFIGFSCRPAKWTPPYAESKEVLSFINATPLVQSLLYDLGLMPEEITDPIKWAHMHAVCGHMDAAHTRAQADALLKA